MAESIGISDMLRLAISMEDDGVAFYKNLADKAEDSREHLFYKPHLDKIVWSEDKGFYKELEEQVIGMSAGAYYYHGMPEKVQKGDSASFYKSLGDRVTDDVKSILMNMSDDEKRHGELFRQWLEEGQGGSSAFSVGAAEFFKEHADKVTFDQSEPSPHSILEALDQAIKTEQGAVDFYSGMAGYASPETKELLMKIIDEERGHRAKLEAQKNKYLLLTKGATVVN